LLEGFFGTLSPVVKTMRWLLVCLICLLGLSSLKVGHVPEAAV